MKKIINHLQEFKDNITLNNFNGGSIAVKTFNKNYYLNKINAVIESFINKDKKAFNTNIDILKTYYYLLSVNNTNADYLIKLNQLINRYYKED